MPTPDRSRVRAVSFLAPNLPRGSSAPRARRLRAADPQRSYASIARELGVSATTVYRACHPEAARRDNARRRAAKRAWERDPANRGPCSCCGALLGIGHRAGRCWSCHVARCNAQSTARREVIADLWLAGASLNAIASALGTTRTTIATDVRRMRAAGWRMPYRRRPKAALHA